MAVVSRRDTLDTENEIGEANIPIKAQDLEWSDGERNTSRMDGDRKQAKDYDHSPSLVTGSNRRDKPDGYGYRPCGSGAKTATARREPQTGMNE
ncbi:hypothetical protein E4U21_001409 [Claviceps maximensis]|nr:hypothetical protein E4U21_001409 [Claviceps maximensis]